MVLVIYVCVLVAVCVRDIFRRSTYNDFVTAGGRQGPFVVFMTLMATMIGASATIGIAAKAETTDFTAFWWLGAGAIGLLAQGFCLSSRIRSLGARTLPEIAGLTVGPFGRKLVAGIIVISWIGVVAAQFSAAEELIRLAAGYSSTVWSVVGTAAFVTLYTLIGGQLSVVKTDLFQFGILAIGFLAVFIYLFSGFAGGTPDPASEIVFFTPKFGFWEFLLFVFPVAGAYFLGPDITSRNLVARDGNVARKATFWAVPALTLFAVVITLIGMWAGRNAPGAGNPLFRITKDVLPVWLASLLSLGLLSALLSSADTCLINTAAITSNDVLGRHSVRSVRIAVLVVGILATFLALRGKDIITLLFSAYAVYTPGIVCPLAVAIIVHGRRRLVHGLWYAAVAVGGTLGLLQPVFGFACETPPAFANYLPLAGMVLSLIIALASVRPLEEKSAA